MALTASDRIGRDDGGLMALTASDRLDRDHGVHSGQWRQSNKVSRVNMTGKKQHSHLGKQRHSKRGQLTANRMNKGKHSQSV